MRLDDGDAARVQTVVACTTLVQVRDHQLADDALRIIVLVAHYAEDAWIHGQRVEILILQPLLELHQLRAEGEVGIGAGSAILNTPVALLVRDPFR